MYKEEIRVCDTHRLSELGIKPGSANPQFYSKPSDQTQVQRGLTEVLFIITKSLGQNTEDHKILKRGKNPKRSKSPTEKAKGKLKNR